MYFKFKANWLHSEIVWEDRTFSYYFILRDRIYSFERYFPKTFRCVSCSEKVEADESQLRLCEEHFRDYMERLRSKLR